MSKISITLPSLYSAACKRTIDNILTTSVSHDIEIIVVGSQETLSEIYDAQRIDHGQVIWQLDQKRNGCNSAHYEASKHATGEFLMAFADDHLLIHGWDNLVVDYFRLYEIQKPFLLGQRQIARPGFLGHIGTVFGIYYPYFPFMRTEDVNKIGGWLSPDYRHGFGDPDLALRVWAAGGYCEWMDIPTIEVITEEDDKHHQDHGQFLANDMILFTNRWKDKYGKGWDVSHVRGFNIDRQINSLPEGARTYYHNSP